jgi:hypothetical protein
LTTTDFPRQAISHSPAGRDPAGKAFAPSKDRVLAALWRYLLTALGLAALLGGVLAAVYLTAPEQEVGPDLSRSKATANGLFFASIEPESGALRQGEMHSWLLTLKTAAGAPVENAAIEISGGMPEHSHGLPTSPQATEYLGGGRYRVDGVKFTMSGWWQLRFAVSAATGSDAVMFNIVL